MQLNDMKCCARLTRDPETRQAGSTTVAVLNVAINTKHRNNSGETKEETCYINVEAFGKQAELIGQYCKKGTEILVEGRLVLDQWESDGQKRSKHKILARHVQWFNTNRDQHQGAPSNTSSHQSTPGDDMGGAPF